MLTRPRLCLDFSTDSHELPAFLILTLVSLLLLGGCGTPDAAEPPQEPAVSVPHGLLNIKGLTQETTPQARAVKAMADISAEAGLTFYTLSHTLSHTLGQDRAESPIAALIKIDLNAFKPQILADPKGLVPAQVITGDKVALVLGSSFISQVRDMQPIGVLLSNGQLLQNVEQHGYTRILGLVDTFSDSVTDNEPEPDSDGSSRFEVVHRSDWPTERFHSALQAGPGIVEEGALDISERDLERPRYFRSFIAECGDQSVVGASLVPVHLYTLGLELVNFFAEQQLACKEVVNLAGDREALLLVRAGETAVYLGDPNSTKAGLISFTQLGDL